MKTNALRANITAIRFAPTRRAHSVARATKDTNYKMICEAALQVSSQLLGSITIVINIVIQYYRCCFIIFTFIFSVNVVMIIILIKSLAITFIFTALKCYDFSVL